MAFLTQTVAIPIWFLIMINMIVLALLVKLYTLVFRFRRGDISREEHSDMVVWKVTHPPKSAVPKRPANDPEHEKKLEKKQDIIKVLKILLHEGDKGLLMQTISDRMGGGRSNVNEAVKKLVEKKMIDEVVGMSGTKYYLTQEGRDYCKRKSS